MARSISDATTTPKPAPARLAAAFFLMFASVYIALRQSRSIVVSGVTFALIDGAYIGFAAHAQSRRVFWMELATAVYIALIPALGILVHWFFLPLGLALYAIWDLLHHDRGYGAAVTSWYIPFWIIFDLAAASFLFLLYGAKASG